MNGHFPNILLYHPAYLSGRVWRPEDEFAKYESLERKPYRRPQPPAEIGNPVSTFEGVTALIGLLVLLVATLTS